MCNKGGDRIRNTIKKGIGLVIIVIFAGFIFQGICFADIIYLKNGRKMEGEIKRTERGLWINGGLFTEDEIDRIEKKASEKEGEDTRPWYAGILSKIGIKAERENKAKPFSATEK